MKNVWKNTKNIFVLIYSVVSIAIFVLSAEYLFYTFSIYTTTGLLNIPNQFIIVDGLMCLQLFFTLFSGLIGLLVFARRVSGGWLIASGCLGIASKVTYIAARIVSLLHRMQFVADEISCKGILEAMIGCCFPIIYVPFCVVILVIGMNQLKKDKICHEKESHI